MATRYKVVPGKCTECGTCVPACSVGAISLHVHGASHHYFVDPSICNGCGACIRICPSSGAIMLYDWDGAIVPCGLVQGLGLTLKGD